MGRFLRRRRARDLLIVPCLPSADDRSWCRIVDLGHDRLPELDLGGLPEPKPEEAAALANEQSPERSAPRLKPLRRLAADRVAAAERLRSSF